MVWRVRARCSEIVRDDGAAAAAAAAAGGGWGGLGGELSSSMVQ